MKRLYKIVLVFFAIFFIGIAITIQSINTFFSSKNTIEIVKETPTLLKSKNQF